MIVPDVVGLPFHVGREVATGAHVVLANPDPDGPPISAVAWPGAFSIVRQDPAPGTMLLEWDSVRVEVIEQGDAPDREAAIPSPSPHLDSAHATPEREGHVDLADG